MTSVIKQAATFAGVRPLPPPGGRSLSLAHPRDGEMADLRERAERLADEVVQMRDAAASAASAARDEAAAAVAHAREEALAEGKRAGLIAAETRDDERLAELVRGVNDAIARFDARLETLDGLAAALARTCLERVFARSEASGDMVAAALERYVSTLRDEAVLTVRVSGHDFAETEALEAMVRFVGARATVTIDRELPAGACRISARLGNVDLDVPAQWTALARMLDGMAGA